MRDDRDADGAEAGEREAAVGVAGGGGLEEPERAGDERRRPAGAEGNGRVPGERAPERAGEVAQHARGRDDEERGDGDQQRERERRAQLLAGEGDGAAHSASHLPSRSS